MKLILIVVQLLVAFSSALQSKSQKARYDKVMAKANAYKPVPAEFVPLPDFSQHRDVKTVVFAAAMAGGWMPRNSKTFVGTLRKTGYVDDVVVAIDYGSSNDFINSFRPFNVVLYNISVNCIGSGHGMRCNVKGDKENPVSINMMRYVLYYWWASKYSADTTILITDFRDVLFQANPFTYMRDQWAPPVADLTVFLESTIQKMIYRCEYNSGWIDRCYGEDALRLVKTNPVSCSGVSLGSRDAIRLYSYMMLEQIDASTRQKYGVNHTVPNRPDCFSAGMDQGFHNWLLYSGILQRFLTVKVFAQGEGPVNTIGSMYPGSNALLKLAIEKDWGILRGESPNKYFANWNGDPSPVVHQMDRFEPSVIPNLGKDMACLQGVVQG